MMRIVTGLTCLLALISLPVVHSGVGQGATISCAPRERRLYTTVFGRTSRGIQLYCADRTSPVAFIPFAEGQSPGQIDHDRSGNLFVMSENLTRLGGQVSIFDSSGVLVAERPEPYSRMLVDRKRGVAHLLYTRRAGDAEETLAGHAVHFAQFEESYRSVSMGSESAEVSLGTITPSQTAPIIDASGNILIDGYRGDLGSLGILDPEKQEIVDHVQVPACILAAGGNGFVYAINCFGELRVFDPIGYRLLSDRKLDVGGPYLGNANDPGRIAIDRNGTVFLTNSQFNTVLRYEKGATKPSAIAANEPRVADLQLDADGNVYALESGESATTSSIRVFDGLTLRELRTYRFNREGLSVDGMTIVDP